MRSDLLPAGFSVRAGTATAPGAQPGNIEAQRGACGDKGGHIHPHQTEIRHLDQDQQHPNDAAGDPDRRAPEGGGDEARRWTFCWGLRRAHEAQSVSSVRRPDVKPSNCVGHLGTVLGTARVRIGPVHSLTRGRARPKMAVDLRKLVGAPGRIEPATPALGGLRPPFRDMPADLRRYRVHLTDSGIDCFSGRPGSRLFDTALAALAESGRNIWLSRGRGAGPRGGDGAGLARGGGSGSEMGP